MFCLNSWGSWSAGLAVALGLVGSGLEFSSSVGTTLCPYEVRTKSTNKKGSIRDWVEEHPREDKMRTGKAKLVEYGGGCNKRGLQTFSQLRNESRRWSWNYGVCMWKAALAGLLRRLFLPDILRTTYLLCAWRAHTRVHRSYSCISLHLIMSSTEHQTTRASCWSKLSDNGGSRLNYLQLRRTPVHTCMACIRDSS